MSHDIRHREKGRVEILPALFLVAICAPAPPHLPMALAVAAAGRHCIVEKPIEINVDKGGAVYAARLGYDSAESWRRLLSTHAMDMADAMKIPLE